MSIKDTKIIICLLLTITLGFTSNADSELGQLIRKLDSVMLERGKYEANVENQLRNLKSLLNEQNSSIENKYFLINKIIEIYEYYSFEEALRYIELNLQYAKELKNNYLIEECNL